MLKTWQWYFTTQHVISFYLCSDRWSTIPADICYIHDKPTFKISPKTNVSWNLLSKMCFVDDNGLQNTCWLHIVVDTQAWCRYPDMTSIPRHDVDTQALRRYPNMTVIINRRPIRVRISSQAFLWLSIFEVLHHYSRWIARLDIVINNRRMHISWGNGYFKLIHSLWSL